MSMRVSFKLREKRFSSIDWHVPNVEGNEMVFFLKQSWNLADITIMCPIPSIAYYQTLSSVERSPYSFVC